ncbi:uncharacterized protein LOC131228702 isoform X2 [Magnolia sinica]|uniref:uncharacterized protein LOC131228702 isoform X2 n=1 Tax=Magnolia sinica TaxID=86752 RepID=UPI0026595863|nr:uncharacterized protein LOC131228702 isoform X2 [Magnolia sinica]
MAAGSELVLRKAGSCSLKEEMAKVTLRSIRNQGHPYVELRENGKRFIFFCTLCLSPCYGETTLLNHLKGNLHAQRYAGAKLTLFGSTPWPFNDGIFFFHQSSEKDQRHLTVLNSNHDRISVANSDNSGTIMSNGHDNILEADNGDGIGLNGHNGSINLKPNDIILGLSCNACDKIVNADDNSLDLVIPGVLVNDEVSILGVRFIGHGHIASKIFTTNEIIPKVRRIWCAWLGEGNSSDQEMLSAPDCDFSIIIFSYTYNLGRKAVVSDLGLLPSSLGTEIENFGSNRKKKRRSFSEPDDIHETQSDDCGSSYGGDSLSSHCSAEKALFLLDDRSENVLMSRQCEGQLQETRLVLSRECRRDLRRQQRLAAERDCDVCKQPMLPGKDVATLLNRKTGNLACSSRNTNGAFHVFHASCLIHWLLLCELEIWSNQSANSKVHNTVDSKSGRKGRAKSSRRKINDENSTGTFISSVFCPECQGTGINIKGDELEKPTVPLSEIFLYKIKAIEAHKAWVKSPEILQRCSTGLHFPSASDENSQVRQVFCLKYC